MNIAGLRIRVTFQKNESITDEIGNHLSKWQDYYSCWATAVTGGAPDTEEAAGHTVEKSLLDITVRYCGEISRINAKEYRIMIGDRIYQILSIDEMGFKKISRKFHAELVER